MTQRTTEPWLIIGSSGQLGQELVSACGQRGIDYMAVGRSECDITNRAQVHALIHDFQPAVVLNAAAWTAVDAAETEEDAAWAVNAQGARNVADASASVDAALVHYSTDYVFNGNGNTPFAENAAVHPSTAYGRSKAEGEALVRECGPRRTWILRTAWLYSSQGANFVKTMLQLSAARDHVQVVDDQVGQPTWARDVAMQTLVLLRAGAPAGTYHATNSGQASWFTFARAVFELAGMDPSRVQPVTSAHFPRPARRPSYSVLGHDGWGAIGLAPMQPWDAALREAMPEILATHMAA